MKTQGKSKNNDKDFVDELSSMLSSERVKRARDDAEKEIFMIRLAELRQIMGIRQQDVKSFTQSGVSKLESRKDIKISTLLEYLDDIGMGVEIKVFPKQKDRSNKEKIILLKS